MYESKEIAYYLVDYAYQTHKENYLSGLKVFPLLFLIQGYSLALLNKKAFDDKITKTGFGVIIEGVYKEFRKYGSLSVPHTHRVLNPEFYNKYNCDIPYYEKYDIQYKDYNKLTTVATYKCDRIDEETISIIEGVFNAYHKNSIVTLNNKIEGLNCYQESKNELSNYQIKKDFQEIVKQEEKERNYSQNKNNELLNFDFSDCSTISDLEKKYETYFLILNKKYIERMKDILKR